MRADGNTSPLPGATPFGKYYLLDRIGAGGMAEVFLAVAVGPEGFQRRLVIKRMLPNLSQDPAFVRMFIDEAKLCGLLSHPNLVQIFEFGAVEESFFIAMEHVEGETLQAVQRKLTGAGRVASVAASLEIARQVCLGLHYAHSMQSATGQPLGIVHRDVSPANVMLSFHGGVKILDFGIARVAEELRETHTQAGTMKGKVSYMSPEQIRMEHVDGRSDIFAVGVVLHELLTGRRLFRASNEYTGARMVLESIVPLPSTVNPEVPAAVDSVVMRALERQRDGRYRTAAELADELEGVLFEMRASPHEPRKLLVSLFPNGPSRTGEVQLPVTPVPGSTGSGGQPTHRLSEYAMLEVEAGVLRRPPVTRRPARRRKWGVLSAMAGIVVAAILFARPPWLATPQEGAITTVMTATAPVTPPSPEQPPPVDPAAAAPPEKPVVEISPDSSPQDDKPVLAELPAEPPADSKRFQPSRRSSASGNARRAAVARGRSPAPREPPAAAAEQPRSCLISVASFPWTELWIDGRDTGQRTPVVRYPVSCGAHKLGLKRRDLKLERNERVTVAPDHELKQYYELSDEYGD